MAKVYDSVQNSFTNAQRGGKNIARNIGIGSMQWEAINNTWETNRSAQNASNPAGRNSHGRIWLVSLIVTGKLF